MTEAKRDSNILMMYRGQPEDRERAITSGPYAVKDFLNQFESADDFAKAATLLAVALGSSVHERLGEEEGIHLHIDSSEVELPIDPIEAAKALQGLQWLSKLTGVEAVREASLARHHPE